MEDLTGRVFDRLTVIGFHSITKARMSRWICKCRCGNIKHVLRQSLLTKHVRSCGCYKREVDQAKAALLNKTHGMSKTPEYDAYIRMIKRCYNEKSKDYNDYGGRGISVCLAWLESFENFLNDVGRRPDKKYLLDRIDVNGNYEPSNCRWATTKQSANNTRKTLYITFKGETKCLSDWADLYNINRKVLYNRIYYLNWSFEKAITEPVKGK